VLILKNICFTIRKDEEKINLIKDNNLKIGKGSFVAVVGPSGCGKTTLLKIIAGINEQSSGKITWNERDLAEQDFSPIELGYVPQFSIAYDELTVQESINIAINIRVKTKDKSHAQNIYNRIVNHTGLDKLSDRRVKVLSGGQKRRLSLALELVTNPRVLLCDEVTSGLDPKSENEIVSLMHSLSKDSDRTIINVTHSLNNLDLYDSVIVLYDGFTVYHGPPSNLNHYFSVSSAEEIYPTLTKRENIEWHESWKKHSSKYEDPLLSRQTNSIEIHNQEQLLSQASAAKQFHALTLRKWKIFLRDRTQIVLHLGMLFLFPILVVLFGLDGIDQPKTIPNQDNSDVIEQLNHQVSVSKSHMKIGSLISGLVMFQVILLTLMASNNSSREIAGEREILEKEKFSGLRISSYLLSKIGFLLILVLLQSVWMGIFVQIFVPSLPGNIITKLIVLFLVNASMTSICLGISGMMRNPEQSSLLSIYLVGFQLPLSGAILALPNWISQITQPFISAYWAWSGSLDSMKGEYFGQSIDAVTQEYISPIDKYMCCMASYTHSCWSVFFLYWSKETTMVEVD
tara:strand:- start:235 stop:1947 length:1713 start_codon:yes stop_codon:yes gene_type:complete